MKNIEKQIIDLDVGNSSWIDGGGALGGEGDGRRWERNNNNNNIIEMKFIVDEFNMNLLAVH